MAKFDKSVLSKYGIKGTTEVIYNPSYELLFEEEMKKDLTGYEYSNRNSSMEVL